MKNFSLQHNLSRRDMLCFIGATTVTWLGGFGIGQAVAGKPEKPAGEKIMTQSCVVRPQQTAGPYFVDEKLNRSDIRSDPSDGSVREGVPLRLTFRVSRIKDDGCIPMSGAVVDVWQCDALGVYSEVLDQNGLFDTRRKKFLRGYQTTNSRGIAEFVTIFPGWYEGRTVHIHFKIRTVTPSGTEYDFTSQIYFDDAVTDQVQMKAPYASKGRRNTPNEKDRIFRQGGEKLILQLEKEAQGYAGTFEIALEIP